LWGIGVTGRVACALLGRLLRRSSTDLGRLDFSPSPGGTYRGSMSRRRSTRTGLTAGLAIAGVLVACGSAAALSVAVLNASAPAPVASAADFITIEQRASAAASASRSAASAAGSTSAPAATPSDSALATDQPVFSSTTPTFGGQPANPGPGTVSSDTSAGGPSTVRAQPTPRPSLTQAIRPGGDTSATPTPTSSRSQHDHSTPPSTPSPSHTPRPSDSQSQSHGSSHSPSPTPSPTQSQHPRDD
jgi:hypothetical protein